MRLDPGKILDCLLRGKQICQSRARPRLVDKSPRPKIRNRPTKPLRRAGGEELPSRPCLARVGASFLPLALTQRELGLATMDENQPGLKRRQFESRLPNPKYTRNPSTSDTRDYEGIGYRAYREPGYC